MATRAKESDDGLCHCLPRGILRYFPCHVIHCLGTLFTVSLLPEELATPEQILVRYGLAPQSSERFPTPFSFSTGFMSKPEAGFCAYAGIAGILKRVFLHYRWAISLAHWAYLAYR
jgi:hypothetical protein